MAQINSLPEISVTKWHELRDRLRQDPTGINRLNVRCAACGHYMTVRLESDTNPRSHAIQILPCGHMIGYKCLKDLIDRGNYSCPAPHCKQPPLRHPRCGHACYGMPMPKDLEEFKYIPPTEPEGGGALTMNCTDCTIEMLVNGISDIHNSMGITGDTLPDNQFRAWVATLDHHPCTLTPPGIERLKQLDIPTPMKVIVKEVRKHFLLECRRLWRTWRVGDLKIGLGLYVDSEYDSTKNRIQRSVKKLGRMLSRKG